MQVWLLGPCLGGIFAYPPGYYMAQRQGPNTEFKRPHVFGSVCTILAAQLVAVQSYTFNGE